MILTLIYSECLIINCVKHAVSNPNTEGSSTGSANVSIQFDLLCISKVNSSLTLGFDPVLVGRAAKSLSLLVAVEKHVT